MLKFDHLFSLDYHPKLFHILLSFTLLGVFSANLLAPSFIAYILYDVIPHSYIYIWLFMHIFVLSLRLSLSISFKKVLGKDKEIRIQYLKKSILLLSITITLYALALWSSFFYHASVLHIFALSIIIVTLSAGALATLISIYHLYLLFVLGMMIPLITMFIYHGEEMFNIFAIIFSIFTISTVSAAYKQYQSLKNTISLEETFQTIFDKSSDGIILIQNNRFRDCNDSIVKMFQYDSKIEVLNTHLSKFMPEKQPDGMSSMKKMLQTLHITLKKGSHSFEWLHQTKTGDFFWVDIVLTKIHLNNEVFIHGIWRDISARKILEEKEEESRLKIELLNQTLESKVTSEVAKNRTKDQLMLRQSRLAQMGEMLSMIAHQWRQPLSAISATTSVLLIKNDKKEYEQAFFNARLEKIVHYAQHLSKTIDDFRGFFSPNKKKTHTHYDEIIHSVLGIMDISLKNKNITLIQELSCTHTLFTYPGEIKQVILNLISNAKEAFEESEVDEPTIIIRTYFKQEQCHLEVIDNAGGISPEIISQIFEPYFSTKKEKDGTGLGLYMSKMIIEEHCDGVLDVQNTQEGSLFSIILTP